MRYSFSVTVNIKNQKIVTGVFDTDHGDCESYPDKQHETDLALCLSEDLKEPLTRKDILIIKMHLIEDRGAPVREHGELSSYTITDLDP